MAVQPSARPDEASSFFPDGRANRPVVAGTVARGQLRTDLHLFTGKRTAEPSEVIQGIEAATLVGVGSHILNALTLSAVERYRYVEDANYVDSFPFTVTRAVLEHGRDRYMICCVVCHDALGTGHGKIVERGYTPPPSYHIERLRHASVGYFFDVITRGYRSMPEYRQQIPPRDRWAIVAYIRALQLSQHFPTKELPADMEEEWRKAAKAKAAGRAPQ
jgi:mono/diheme cytochrome c family protein